MVKWITLLFFISFNLLATDYCSPIRLDKDPAPSPMKHVPVVDQALNTCYAHAAAQLIDAYRFSHDPPKGDHNYRHHTFSLDLAIKSKDNWWFRNVSGWFHGQYKNTPSGGLACNAVNAGIKKGVSCSKEYMLKKAGLLAGWDKDFTYILQQNSNLETYMANLDQLYNRQEDILRGDLARNCNKCKSNNEFKELVDIIKALKHTTTDKIGFYAKVVQAQCKKCQIKINKNIYCYTGSSYRSHLKFQCKSDFLHAHDDDECEDQPSDLEILHQELKDKPVGISYCSQFLLEGEKFTGLNFFGMPRNDCGGHASLVIGRKRVGNKCMLLIRNSWGTSCNMYSKDFECEHGNIWVDEQVLKRNLKGINFLYDGEK